MALLDDIKMVLRVRTDALDAEVAMLIDAAKADMIRVGVREELVNPKSESAMNPLVKQAIALYAKANFGFDNGEAERFNSSYRQTVCDLMNSKANIAAMEGESE